MLGAWNEGGDWEIVEKEQFEEGVEHLEGSDARDVTINVKERQKETVKTRKRA